MSTNNKYRLTLKSVTKPGMDEVISIEGPITYNISQRLNLSSTQQKDYSETVPHLMLDAMEAEGMSTILSTYSRIIDFKPTNFTFEYLSDTEDVIYKLEDKQLLEISSSTGNNRQTSFLTCSLVFSFIEE